MGCPFRQKDHRTEADGVEGKKVPHINALAFLMAVSISGGHSSVADLSADTNSLKTRLAALALLLESLTLRPLVSV